MQIAERSDELNEPDLSEVVETAPDDDIVDALNLELGDITVSVKIQARIGGPMEPWNKQPPQVLPLPISASTGVLQIPTEHTWKGVTSRGLANKNFNLVRAFTLSLLVPDESRRLVLVMRRGGDNRYQELNYGTTRERDRIYTIRDIPVLATTRTEEMQKFQSAPPVLVYTAGKRQNHQETNRVDIVIMDHNGFLELWQLVIQTFDDGTTFRLIPEQRLEGEWQRLRMPMRYQPTASEELYQRADIGQLMRNLIFLPSATFPGFDQKAELLLLPPFLKALGDYHPSFVLYDGTERNHDLKLVETVTFRNPRQGVVKLWDKTGAGGFGIVERMEGNGTIRAFAFNIRSFKADSEFNSYGDPVIVRGDHVTWEEEIEMPNKQEGSNKIRPPLVHGLVVVHQTML